MTAIRTWLFAPGDRPSIMAKALASHADAVILDLEDAVAKSAKPAARDTVAAALRASSRPGRYVRINDLATDFAHDDVMALAESLPTGLVLPKAESAEDVRLLQWLLGQVERRVGYAGPPLEIVPLLETAAGLSSVSEIAAASSRVRRLAFGAGDFTLDLSLTWSREEQELLPYRSAIVLASRVAGLEAPVDAVWVRVDDADGMAASAARSRDHGFQGKLCIHPSQVDAVRTAFRPSPEAVARARRIVAAFAAAEGAGHAAIRVDGALVDYPIYEAARRTLADAGPGDGPPE
ncbi:HpcH/HpaI aldolase/citrate lyase family protein [Sphingomonas profundi]|uniref:HpcH/HpaI aldolase/citrate lyase family protein n=1 Tax=Alterirhizorhabdus profundi TaxID=2681549 RepID=UPI0012E8E299|nr:CoA ester lyase [Sphingomonas profundi]